MAIKISMGGGMCKKSLPILLALVLQIDFLTSHGAEWEIKVVDNGVSPSIALKEDIPHIAYSDGLNIRYAYWTGTHWEIETVAFGTEYTSCLDPSLDLDKNGSPHISYGDWPHYKLNSWADLHNAYRTDSGWKTEIVDSVGDIGLSSSLELSNNGHPHISYYSSSGLYLKYAYRNDSIWQIMVVDSTGYVGDYNALGLDTNGYPCIAYHSYTNQDLKYAHLENGQWKIEVVDIVGKVGESVSLAMDRNSNPHISYYDIENRNLKYANWTDSGWEIQYVDTNGEVGEFSSIAIDEKGHPHIAYYDLTNGNLKYAYFGENGWHIELVDTAGDVGHGTSIAVDTHGNPHIAYHDCSNGVIKYAKRSTEGIAENKSSRQSLITDTKVLPNPFTEFCAIDYRLSSPCHVTVKVYTLTGRLINTLTDQFVNSGNCTLIWDGNDAYNKKVRSGIYFCQIRANNNIVVKKLIVLR